MARDPQASGAVQNATGLPVGFTRATPFPFAGINQTDARLALQDQEFYWIENLLRIGNGSLRALWDIGPSLYAAPTGKTIVYDYFFNIGPVNYVAVFLSDGTAYQVAQSTGAVTTILATAGTFYVANGMLPSCSGYGGQYLLIGNNNTANDYWIWDGTVLYSAGSIGPNPTITAPGSGYTSTPTVTAYGGSGFGIVVTPVITDGAVTGLTVVNPGTGYIPGDQVQFLFTGGGTDNGAEITAQISGGSLGPLTIVNGGAGYSADPTIGFTGGGGGSGAAATAVMTGGTVTGITLTNPGSGYTSNPGVTFTGSFGTGAAGTATLSGSAVGSITVSAPGGGYTVAPLISFTGGGGSGATATAIISGGIVTSIVVNSGGTGYGSPPTVVVTNVATSASARASLLTGIVSGFTVVNGGTNFTSTPLVTVIGGGGSGATGTAVLTSGVITSVTLTNGGSGYTSVPAVTVSAGLNSAAQAVASLMPYGISGVYIEIYQSRVWIAHPYQATSALPTGGIFNVSAPESLVDFATSDGGDQYTSSDRFLRYQFTFLRQSNGYLYAAGDSSASVISNVQTTGNPATTSFNYQNADPQIGSAWPNTAQDFGRTILFANQLGVFGIYGGSVTKISAKLDRIFQNIILPGNAAGIPCVTPSAATAVIYNTKVYVLLVTITDPFTGLPRTVQLLWDEKNWYAASSAASLTFISPFETNSGLFAYGTDGAKLYPMFNTASSVTAKYAVTKYWGAERIETIKASLRWYVVGQDMSAAQDGVDIFWTTDYAGSIAESLPGEGTALSPNNATGAVVLGGSNQGMSITFGMADGVYAPLLGFKVSSTSSDFVLNQMQLAYQPAAPIYA